MSFLKFFEFGIFKQKVSRPSVDAFKRMKRFFSEKNTASLNTLRKNIYFGKIIIL